MATFAALNDFKRAFYRLVGTVSADAALVENGETADDVCLLALTHGCWAAQMFMIDAGMADRWRKRTSALSWSGSDAAGGRFVELSSAAADFLRLSGDFRRSSLVDADFKLWGSQVEAESDHVRGHHFFLKNDRLYLTIGAGPPTTVYLDYHYRHPEFTSAIAAFDFPLMARGLIPAMAAQVAAVDAWLPIGEAGFRKIDRAVDMWKNTAQDIARQSRAPRQMKKVPVQGNHWFG